MLFFKLLVIDFMVKFICFLGNELVSFLYFYGLEYFILYENDLFYDL